VIRLDRLGQRTHALLYIQEAAVDRALFRSVADLEIFRRRKSASPIASTWVPSLTVPVIVAPPAIKPPGRLESGRRC
jgi:hypothetical protein